jgi:4-hydroxy-3-polyprenylbenzoate decarboxylase
MLFRSFVFMEEFQHSRVNRVKFIMLYSRPAQRKRGRILRLLVGITGTTGVIYGIRLLQTLRTKPDIETHLIITPAGERTISIETEYAAADVRSLADYSYHIDDIAAAPASGSFLHDGMVIAPCSMKTVSAIASSHAEDLLTRAADVTLKERRTLVLLARETPLHAGHLRNMLRVAEMGGVILPPVPAFYHRPRSIEDIVDHAVGKTLDLFRIEHTLFERWRGVK